MKERRSPFINLNVLQLLRYTLFAGAVYFIIIYLWIAYHRLGYPFELEWVEGAMVDQVQRIVQGGNIYVAPGINFVPFIYTPLYFYVSAVASAVFGGSLFPLRLVSFIASLGSFIAIFLIVRAETRNWWAAVLSVGLFAASFRVTGAWLDLARVDSLFLALWLFFIYFARGKRPLWVALPVGVLAALAFLTKQTALFTCLPVLAYLFWRDWKFGLSSLAIATIVVGMTTLAFDLASGGWYSYYIFGLLSQTEWLLWILASFWKDDLFVHVPFAVLFSLFIFLKKPGQDRASFIQWLSILAGALAGTLLTRAKVGGYDNVLLPAYAVISILFGLGLNELLKFTDQPNAIARARFEILILAACLVQFVILSYNPFAQIPTKQDLAAGNDLIQLISKVKGDVYLPDHGYLATLAGKRTYATQATIVEVLRGIEQTEGKTLLTEDLQAAIRQQAFDMIILDSLAGNYCCVEIDQYYTRVGDVFQNASVFYPVTGWQKRPTIIYIADRLK